MVGAHWTLGLLLWVAAAAAIAPGAQAGCHTSWTGCYDCELDESCDDTIGKLAGMLLRGDLLPGWPDETTNP